jgi:hypothetical protein
MLSTPEGDHGGIACVVCLCVHQMVAFTSSADIERFLGHCSPSPTQRDFFFSPMSACTVKHNHSAMQDYPAGRAMQRQLLVPSERFMLQLN